MRGFSTCKYTFFEPYNHNVRHTYSRAPASGRAGMAAGMQTALKGSFFYSVHPLTTGHPTGRAPSAAHRIPFRFRRRNSGRSDPKNGTGFATRMRHARTRKNEPSTLLTITQSVRLDFILPSTFGKSFAWTRRNCVLRKQLRQSESIPRMCVHGRVGSRP